MFSFQCTVTSLGLWEFTFTKKIFLSHQDKIRVLFDIKTYKLIAVKEQNRLESLHYKVWALFWSTFTVEHFDTFNFCYPLEANIVLKIQK